jgi:hypothetical protein
MDLEFSGDIWYWRGPSPFYFVTVPEDGCAALREVSHVSYGWGMIPVRVRIGGSEWETSLWPKDGRYIVPLKARVRQAEDLDEGATVAVALSVRGDEPGI